MGKKFKKRLRSFLSFFACGCHALQKPKNDDEPNKLQILLCKSLEIQMEERQCQLQIKNTLLYLVSLLEKFHKNPFVDESRTAVSTRGNFGLAAQISQDKAIQSSNTPSTSQTIQTLRSDIGFDLGDFKLGLLQHMRQLKQDVLMLKQLLCNADQLAGSFSSRRQEFDFDYLFQSKTRALNFAKFYKLRKLDEDKNKKSLVSVGKRLIRRRCNF